jgi:predicted RNase H-like nuclease (RuvC/YqgF family)
MILGGHKDIKLCINRMPKAKTYRRRHQSKRKTSRRHSRRHTRKRGGGCESLKQRYEALKSRAHLIRLPTYEDKWNRVRTLYNEVAAKQNNADCVELAKEIQDLEMFLKNQTNTLMGH